MYSIKDKYSIMFNIFIIIFEILGIVVYMLNSSYFDFAYYTHDSNILALLSSSIYLIFVLKKKEIPKWVSILRYASVLSLALTFLVVIFVLLPMYDFNYKFILLEGAMPYFHIICPILTFISFIIFEEHNINDNLDVLRALYFSIAYSVIIILLNIIDMVEGPYPFLMIKKNSIVTSIIWFMIIDGGAIILAKIIQVLKNRIDKK